MFLFHPFLVLFIVVFCFFCCPVRIVLTEFSQYETALISHTQQTNKQIPSTAPWCGHCKKLYPDFLGAARKLEGEDAFLGWVDATEESELASMYKVQGYPTIKLFPGGAGKSFQSAIDYNGGRTITDIVTAVLAEVDRSGVPKPMPELISNQVMEKECSGQNHICVLAALP